MRLNYSQIDFSNAKFFRRVLLKASPFYAIITRKIWKHSNHSKSTFHENTFLWKFIWYSNRIIGCFPRTNTYPVSISFDCHVKMNLDLSRLTDCFAYCYGIGESDIGYFISKISKPNSLIIDVGANIGTATLFFAKKCPNGNIYSFEPSPLMRKVLRENIKINKLKNIKVFPYALSNKRAIARLKIEFHGNPGSAFITNTNDNGIKVNTIPLDMILSRQKRIDIIKIDVEGHELKVIMGGEKLIKFLKPIIIFEVNTKAINLPKNNGKKLIQLLNKWNYSIFYLKNGELLPFKMQKFYQENVYNLIAINNK